MEEKDEYIAGGITQGDERDNWDKRTISETVKNILDNSTTTTQREGDLAVYKPDEYKHEELNRQPDRTNYYDQLFGKFNPAPSNRDEEDRLRRVAKIQALGDLFKHLGNFAGAGYAPVEKWQDNGRLYQTLNKIDAERARFNALANQYGRDKQAYINMMNKADRDAWLQDQRIRQSISDNNVKAINDAKRYSAEQHDKNLPTTTVRQNNYKPVTDRRISNNEINPKGSTANRGGITYSSKRTNLNYRIPEEQISNLYSQMTAPGLELIPIEKQASIYSLVNPEEKIFGMKQAVAEAMAKYDERYNKDDILYNFSKKYNIPYQNNVRRFWDNEMKKYATSVYENDTTPAVFDFSGRQNQGQTNKLPVQPQQPAEPIPDADETVILSWDDI